MTTRRAGTILLATGIILALGFVASEERLTRHSEGVRRAGIRSPGPTAQEEGDISVQPSPLLRVIPPKPRITRPRVTAPAANATTRTTRTSRPGILTLGNQAPTNSEEMRLGSSPSGRIPVPPPRSEPETAPTPAPSVEPAPSEVALPPAPVLIPPVLLTQTAAYPDEATRIVLDRTLITPELRLVASEGRVVLRVLVQEDGSVAEVRILSPSGNPVFDRAAMEAAAAWRFRPATRDGVPIAAWAIIPVRFIIP